MQPQSNPLTQAGHFGVSSFLLHRRTMNFNLMPAHEADLDGFIAIRLEAMRESLERIGRFDPARAAARLRDSFSAADTRHIVMQGERIGFIVVKQQEGGLLLEHLYLRPAFQRRGIGTRVLERVFEEADAQGLVVHVGALRESPANEFYVRHGFNESSASEWDNYYMRDPKPK